VEIALVHRPKYDDWSIPKGKLDSGEHPLAAAVREVWEETGFDSRVGPSLGEIRYLKDGVPKRVRYWCLETCGGGFEPTDEVDKVMWLPPREAQQHLDPDRDREVAVRFEKVFAPTWPVVLVRHGSAGERSDWPLEDRARPLDEVGHAQATALIPVLEAFRIRRALSADVLRCIDTIGPFTSRHRLTVESEPLVSESGYAAHPDAAVQRVVGLLSEEVPTVVCSQGKAMPQLVTTVCDALRAPRPADPVVPKGGFWVLHFAANGKRRLAGLDRFDAITT
jgi:8-oxo-dGTP diphosphatase